VNDIVFAHPGQQRGAVEERRHNRAQIFDRLQSSERARKAWIDRQEIDLK
jgi:hypothetical protein